MRWRAPRGALGELVERARLASAERKARSGRESAETAPKPRTPGRFHAALADRSRRGFPLICEVKRASPSAGAISISADAVAQATAYVAAGARCVSVLTEQSRFGGSLEDLRRVRAAVDAPLLRKDFIVDAWMVEEAARAGADAVLLIAAAVEPSLLGDLADRARSLGLDVLLELAHERDLDALGLRAWDLAGINARDLETLEMDADRFDSLAGRAAAPGRLLVAESGIRGPDDVRRYRAQGADAALVGEALMRAERPGELIASLVEAD
jgi:indole-3-glycerol phosphate synthase